MIFLGDKKKILLFFFLITQELEEGMCSRPWQAVYFIEEPRDCGGHSPVTSNSEYFIKPPPDNFFWVVQMPEDVFFFLNYFPILSYF